MVHQVFLNALDHNFFQMSLVNLLVVDECHHTVGKSAYMQIFQGHYFSRKVKQLSRYFSEQVTVK